MSDTITNFYAPDDMSVEQLRVILERERGDVVPYDEAAEVGTQLLSLYECLAREREIPKDDSHHE